ncbi:TetR/AcrR family transcriptional regulator [Paractinoplanes ferrugineus]|uniref:TetR family transcriptional regulator n=1 Tax=Paractinoplanes ferrugineus TaxID=113564 RepID=A0A919MFN9_9ACTN|nr:TetR/AcrR family transcriptional regulator [Actinoplanes ferrugineus]GIE12964.1 TetR family transcriptional regulator [Actinoplanes ferrugineus]
MTTVPLRKDAARNWHRILEVGRGLVDEGAPIQLNDVARAASVGVATVYRHFPTPEALVETIAGPGIEALIEHAESALPESAPDRDESWAALRDFLFAGVDAQARDASLQPVFAAPRSALPRTAELKERLAARYGELFDRARAAGAVDPGVAREDLVPLMCGVIFAASVHPTADRAATARRYLAVLLDGVRRR